MADSVPVSGSDQEISELRAKHAYIMCKRCGTKVTNADVCITSDFLNFKSDRCGAGELYSQQIRVDVYHDCIHICLNAGDQPQARKPLSEPIIVISNLCRPIDCDCIENEDVPEYKFFIVFPRCKHYYDNKSDRFNKDDNVYTILDIEDECGHLGETKIYPDTPLGKVEMLPHYHLEYRIDFPMLFSPEENKWSTKYIDTNNNNTIYTWCVKHPNVKGAR